MKKVTIIAEAGVNHNGDITIAKKMIDVAKMAGVDIIKFQTGIPKNIISRYAKKAEYQIVNTKNAEESQLEMVEKFSLNYDDFYVLKEYAESQNIEFLSTPFDIESADYLHSIGMRTWKIPSGEITNLPYLEHIGRFGEKIIMSTGMSTIDEVRSAVEVLRKVQCGAITLLHCTTNYPANYTEVNLRAMFSLKEEFGVEVGYSDHTIGIEVPIAATALGATIIEKHFTLDCNMKGPDHKASIEPTDLKKMVLAIRNIEKALGNGEKLPSKEEISNIAVARKSIVANCDIKKGELLTKENLTTKRPGNGISPMSWYNVIGTVAKRDFCIDELIEL